MNLPVVLDVCDRKTLLGKKISFECIDGIHLAKIQEKKKALKKVVDAFVNDSILINNQVVNKNIFRGKIKQYHITDFKMIFKIADKICRMIAAKYSRELPLNEIVIIAENEFAYPLIFHLLNISKMFTIISSVEDRRMSDEMYFKYGCVIRHKNSLKEVSEENNFILCADDKFLEGKDNSIILNLTRIYDKRKNVINIQDIRIKDKRFQSFIECWNGCPGLDIYSMLNVFPDENSTIEINRNTDRIFLLDTDAI